MAAFARPFFFWVLVVSTNGDALGCKKGVAVLLKVRLFDTTTHLFLCKEFIRLLPFFIIRGCMVSSFVCGDYKTT